MHLEDEWEGGVRWADWDAFVGEDFVVKRQKRRRQGDSFRSPPPFVESSAPWAREDTGDEPLFGIRKKIFRYNTKNLVFASIPLCVFNDAFNAWSMSIKIFLRGGPLTWVSDSPQRAKLLYCKHPNNSTKLPCPYCKFDQDERLPTCGDLGNARHDVEANRRTWGEAQDGWRELQALDLAPNEQTKRSAELGIWRLRELAAVSSDARCGTRCL
ncbi:unnamed protein product [Ectocarpus sp. CCAP 1310/34]|nr:unnamed protein product [Ectocarpus sp. CCAP 1310/34]